MKGSVIGQYRVTDVLGEGGMGVVYAAEHTLLGRPAAVKLLLPELSRKQEIVQRFFNEARAATAIRHPGIVEIYDFGWTNDGAAFIVMELLQGETLRARRMRGKMPWSAALAVTRQIAGALGAAHAKGIVHRDLKPDNIFLVPDPEVPGGERIKLLDFGIAKLAGSAVGQHMTRTGAVIGTPTYMAPEQCRGVAVDSRADLYALGCILFELCAGRPPFVGEGEGDVLAAHIHMPVPALGTIARGVPKQIEALVQRLLAKSPLERVQTAEEIIRMIDAASTATGSGRALTAAPVPTAAPRPPKAAAAGGTAYSETTLSSAASSRHTAATPPSRRRLLLFGAAGAAVALAGVIAIVAGGGSDTPSSGASIPYGSVAAASPDASAEPAPPSPPAPPAASAPAPPAPPAASAPPAPPAASAPAPSPSPSPATATAPPPATAPSPAPMTTPAASDPSTSPPAVAKTPSSAERAPPREAAAPSNAAKASRSSSPARPAVSKPAPEAPPPPPSTIEVMIQSSPAGAEVFRGGSSIGHTPLRIEKRTKQDVKLVLKLRGHQDQPVTVHTSAPGKQHVKLVPVAAHDKGVNPFK